MIDSKENKELSTLRRFQVLVLACTLFSAFDDAAAFSIDRNFRGHQLVTPSAHSHNIATNSMYMRAERIPKRNVLLLYEQAVAPMYSEGSNVTVDSEHDLYIFQSDATMQYDRFTTNSTGEQRSMVDSVTVELSNTITDLQMMTLKSKITKYIVPSPNVFTGNANHLDSSKRFIILWRNLLNDTPELAGYPVSFLAEQMKSIMHFLDLKSNTSTALTSSELAIKNFCNEAEIDWDLVSPYMDDYTFEVGGGLTGLVYGVTGVAEGTKICTTSVGELQATIPRNYIQTGDGCIYELGRPAISKISETQIPDMMQSYSLSGNTKEQFRNGKETIVSQFSKGIRAVDDRANEDTVIDSDLLNLAGLTTLVLGGAMAMETLSHHLTVNVFWV